MDFSVSNKRHLLRKLRFSFRDLLLWIGVSALLVTLWLPRIHQRIETAKNRRAAIASSRLFEFVAEREPALVAEQLALGADPNTKSEIAWDGTGRNTVISALNLAIRNNDDATIQILLDGGADPNIAVPQYPLQFVLLQNLPFHRKQAIAERLLEARADPQHMPQYVDRTLERGLPEGVAITRQHALDYGIREMCIAGDLAGLQSAGIVARINDVKVLPYRGTSTLLGIALLRSHSDIASWLLDNGATVEVGEANDATALHLAAVGNCTDLIQPLVTAGGSANAKDISGDAPLHYAIPASNLATIQSLIAVGADVNMYHQALGMYPLHLAARRYAAANDAKERALAESIIATLLAAGADASLRDSSGVQARLNGVRSEADTDDIYQATDAN